MIVEINLDDDARRVFAERAVVLQTLLNAMVGLRTVSVTMLKNSVIAHERYTLDAGCEAEDQETAWKAMETTLKVMTEGLMHTIHRLPEAWKQSDGPTQRVRNLGAMRALVMNQPGHLAAAQRGHEPLSSRAGPDVV